MLKIFDRPPGADGHVYWTADGKTLEYVVEAAGVGNVWRQGFDGGRPVPLTAFTRDRIFFMSPSLDRTSVAMARGWEVNDVVLIRGTR